MKSLASGRVAAGRFGKERTVPRGVFAFKGPEGLPFLGVFGGLMKPAPLPANEGERLRALQQYQLLDSNPEPEYDDLVSVASQLSGLPIALVSLVDEERQWFKAKVGLDAEQTPRDLAFCAHAILEPAVPFVVFDSHLDERFADNPLVTGAPHVRSYWGVPLREPERRLPIGTLCVIGHEPREPTPAQLQGLQALGRQVERLLQLRLDNSRLRDLNTELRRARESADAANEEKSRFLATVSHDLRTPMNGVIGGVQLLRDTLLSDSQKSLLEMVETCGQSLLYLINDVLDLSKVESGGLQLLQEPVNLRRVIDDVAKVLQARCTAQGIRLETQIESGFPQWVRGDTARLHQVLLNLASNAVKFTSSGSVRIVCTAGGKWFEVAVEDTGAGMSALELSRIFEPFAQGRVGAAHAEGTGLGLSIVRAIADAWGGQVNAESEEGKGSRFVARLPLESCQGPDIVEVPVVPELSPDGPKRVLVVDDNAINQRVVGALLNRLGIEQVVTASNGMQAVALANDADLILMDCQMPGMDGLEATRQIRSLGSRASEVPIVALTANALASDQERCYLAGMDSFVTKPVRKSQLYEALRTRRRSQ